MVAEMNVPQLSTVALKSISPRKTAVTNLFPHVWPSAPDLDQLHGGKLSALNKVILPKEGLAM